MHLDVAGELRAAVHPQPGPAKIGTAQQVPDTRRTDLQLPPVGQHRLVHGEVPAQPDFLHHALSDGERAVEPCISST